jgi:hypothetical protein
MEQRLVLLRRIPGTRPALARFLLPLGAILRATVFVAEGSPAPAPLVSTPFRHATCCYPPSLPVSSGRFLASHCTISSLEALACLFSFSWWA